MESTTQSDQFTLVELRALAKNRAIQFSYSDPKEVILEKLGLTLGNPVSDKIPESIPEIQEEVKPGFHPEINRVVNWLNSRDINGKPLNIWLHGPAGTGKSTLAIQAAEKLDLRVEVQSVGPQTVKSDFLGYTDIRGEYISTPIRRAYEQGSLYLCDEIDAGNPGVLTTINGIMENRYTGFPDKTVERHPDFRVIATANTLGIGGNANFCGRLKLDLATRKRFVFLEIGYSAELELAKSKNKTVCKKLQSIRVKLQELGIDDITVSLRDILQVETLLAAGESLEFALKASVFNTAPELINKVL